MAKVAKDNQLSTEKALQVIARAEAKAKQRAAEAPTDQIQLPLLLPDERGLPNALARAALFNAAKTGESLQRQYYKKRLIASLSNIKIEYRGEELRQDDCSVFIALLYFQQRKYVGEDIPFTAYEMLKELGWSINKDEYIHLRECCERLSATNVSISFTDGSKGFAGSLLRYFAWKDDNGKTMSHWVARFETSISRFFEEDSFSIIDPRIRRKISGRAPLAQWLHNFFSTHRKPFALSVAKYHELTDSRAKDLSDFRSRLKLALQRLVDAKFLSSFEIRDDIVYVKRVEYKFGMPTYRSSRQENTQDATETIEA